MNVTFKDIQKANETINTLDIKGKDYALVNERIKAFRMVYPTGTIRTEMISNENGVCIFRAFVYARNIFVDNEDAVFTKYDCDLLLGTGTAYEKENSTFINKTSYIENCETSAVGRALAMAGFGIDTSIASAEEVNNAMNNQKEETEKKKLVDRFNALISVSDYDYEKVLSNYGVKDENEMCVAQLKNAIKILEKEQKV